MARWLTIFVWGAVAASAAFWGWKLMVPTPHTHAAVVTIAAGPLDDLSRLLGAASPPKPVPLPIAREQGRFQLIGVIAAFEPSSAGEGVAVIVVDGLRARAYRAGAMLDSNWAVRAIETRRVSLASRSDGVALSLELPPPRSAATVQLLPAVVDAQTPPRSMHPARTDGGATQDRAPNTLLNNPADMDPVDAVSQAELPRR